MFGLRKDDVEKLISEWHRRKGSVFQDAIKESVLAEVARINLEDSQKHLELRRQIEVRLDKTANLVEGFERCARVMENVAMAAQGIIESTVKMSSQQADGLYMVEQAIKGHAGAIEQQTELQRKSLGLLKEIADYLNAAIVVEPTPEEPLPEAVPQIPTEEPTMTVEGRLQKSRKKTAKKK